MAKRYGTGRLTVDQYVELPESMAPMELVYGVVREPPGPVYAHQSTVTGLTALLFQHVRQQQLGQVCVSPVDVVLDKEKALVVQPDIIFIAAARTHIIGSRVWGAPDLVIEILSRGTARRDRTTKVNWYRKYGVRECWLVDHVERYVDVLNLTEALIATTRFAGTSPMSSRVLPTWVCSAESILAG